MQGVLHNQRKPQYAICSGFVGMYAAVGCGYIRLVQSEKAWVKLGLEADRREFLARVEKVRIIRIGIMHFSPDADDASETSELESVVRFCRKLMPYD